MTTPAREYRVIGYTDGLLREVLTAGSPLNLVNTDPSTASRHPSTSPDQHYLTLANTPASKRRTVALQCSAKAKGTGQRCRRYSTIGGTTCYSHGGWSPQARRVAAQRMAAVQVHRQTQRHRARLAAWERRRAEVVARLFGWRIEDVLAQPTVVAIVEQSQPALLARCGRRPEFRA